MFFFYNILIETGEIMEYQIALQLCSIPEFLIANTFVFMEICAIFTIRGMFDI